MEHRRIPNSLKKYRRMAGLSQKQVAAKLGIKKTNCICIWEKGYCLPATKYFLQLCLLYRASPENLYAELVQGLKEKLFAHSEPISSN